MKYRAILVFSDQGLISISNFITGVIVARALGIEGFGEFSLALLTVTFLYLFHLSIIVSPMMSNMPRVGLVDRDRYFISLLFVDCLFLLLIWLIGGLVKEIVVFSENFSVTYFLLMVSAYLIQDLMRRFLFATKKYLIALIIDLISYFGQIIILGYLWLNVNLTLDDIFITISLTSFLSFVFGLKFLKYRFVSKEFFKYVVNTHFKAGKWLLAGNSSQWVANQVFILMAGVLLSSSVVGSIKAAQSVLAPFQVLFMGFENILPTKFSTEYIERGKPGLISLYLKISILGSLIIWGGVSILVFFSGEILSIIYGNGFEKYSYIVTILAITYGLHFLLYPAYSVFRTLEMNKRIFDVTLYAALISLLIVYPLISLFEVNGVLIGILFIELVMVFTAMLYMRDITVDHKVVNKY